MPLAERLNKFIRERIKGLSDITRKTINILGLLVGIKKVENKYCCKRLTSTGWVFLLGIPIGYIFLGASFSIVIWASIVLVTTIFCNLDYIYELTHVRSNSTFCSYT
jgi:hypothetical protein